MITSEEILIKRGREAMAQAFYALQPEDAPRGGITTVLDAQKKCVQMAIRRRELTLEQARRLGAAEFDAMIEHCGLRRNLVDSSVVLRCLSELLDERLEREILGYGVDEATVDQQAEEWGLTIVEPECQRGRYVGTVVGLDHRALLLKFCQNKAIVLLFDVNEFAYGLSRPNVGNTVRMEFNKGALTVSVREQ